jgi:hypothetical protein
MSEEPNGSGYAHGGRPFEIGSAGHIRLPQLLPLG